MEKRICILDDDADVLEVVQQVLEYEGFEVVTAGATEDIVELITTVNPQLLLVDYSLNGTNGGELCARLKDAPATSQLPVIIFSAYSNKGLKAGSYGCQDFIAKPFSLDELVNKITQFIGNPLTDGNSAQALAI